MIMRKWWKYCAALLLCWALFPAGTTAEAKDGAMMLQGERDIVLQSGSHSRQAGERFTITVEARGAANLYASDIRVTYDNSRLAYIGTETMGDGYSFAREQGNMLLLVHTLTGEKPTLSGNMPLHTLTFEAIREGTAEIALSEATLVLKDADLETQAGTTGGPLSIVIHSGSNWNTNNGGDSPANAPAPGKDDQAKVTTGEGSTTVSLEVDAKEQSAIVSIDQSLLRLLVQDAVARRQAVISIPAVQGARSYGLRVPFSHAASGLNLRLETPEGSMVLTDGLLRKIADDGKQVSDITIRIEPVSPAGASTAVREAIGHRPLIGVRASVNGETAVRQTAADFVVSIPYNPSPEELARHEHLVIWAINEAGVASPVPSGRYDPAAGAVTFVASGFDQYGIAFVHKAFADIGEAEWSRKSVEVLASKGIIDGVSAAEFAPAQPITRGEFLKLLIPLLQLDAQGQALPSFEDVQPDDYYYEAISVAQALGIVQGTGNNQFSPNAPVSREDMFVMVYRALLLAGAGLEAEDSGVLNAFGDREEIADYAIQSAAVLADNGIVVGDGSNLHPKSSSTRAESAVLLYRLYADAGRSSHFLER